MNSLTAMVLTALWRAAKKNGSAQSQITDAIKERKRSQMKHNTLLIESLMYVWPFTVLFYKEKSSD